MKWILIECLTISALFIFALCIRVFNDRWKNIVIYALLSTFILCFISTIFQRYWAIEYSVYLLLPYLFFLLISFTVYKNRVESKPKKNEDVFTIKTENIDLEFYYPRDNFLVYGGAGSGKTASIGKPILEEFIKNGWAGFIYDYKDFDYTKTAYNLIKKHNYPFKFYYVSFTDMSRTYRFNILKKTVITSDLMLFQLIDDFINASAPADVVKNDSGGWLNGAKGLLKGIAIRFYNFRGEYEKYCTLPHILNFILQANSEQLVAFLEGDVMSKIAAGAFLGSRSSERTRDSYASTLNNYIANLAMNKNVCYVLTGDDFDFYLNDPEDPKMFAVSNNFAIESMISPIIAMLVPISSRKIEFGNKIKFAYVLDEMTTVKINNFQNMPSVLREYGAAFLIMTQSGSKLESLYGKHDRASIEANCANLFLGRTKDVEALKYYPLFFGKEDKEKKSYSAGSQKGGGYNSSVTRSQQREEVYDSKIFAGLKQGEFIFSGGQTNINSYKGRFKMFQLNEEALPIVQLTTEKDVEKNYTQICVDVERLIREFCGE